MPQRAVVIGLDGAAWHLIDPLLEAGAMPNLGALRVRGSSGILRSTVPPVTPPAWTSAFTGVNPGRHGIFGFHRGNAQSEKQELMHSGRVQAPTVWEVANAQDVRVGVFNVPLTFPPQKLDGWMVSGMMTPGLGQHLTGFVFPAELEQRLLAWIPDYVVEMSSNWEQDWRDASLCKRALESLEQRHTALERLLEEDPCDLVFSVLEAPDRLQHMYYRYLDPKDELYDSPDARVLRPDLTRCFELMDRIVGLLADYAGDGGVIVCSDHGFTAWEMSVHTNALLAQWGLLELKPAARAMQSRIARGIIPLARRVLPTKLRRQAKRQTFAAIDWSQTRAFASPDYLQGIFLNLKGRERLGIVPESELDALKTEIAERFGALRGPDGDVVTDRVWRSEEIFHGDAAESAPDLVLAMKDHRFEPDDELFHKNPFTDQTALPRGVHHPDGLVVVAGPGVRAGHPIEGSIMDIAPTLLYQAGLKVPEGLDGEVLTEAFEPDHLERNPIETTEPPAPKTRDEASPYSEEEEALIEESLRGLGYL
ncbi:MAG: alkaline phosphatase family protein [Actinomycetota bacterium]